MTADTFRGLDDFRAALRAAGWRIERNGLANERNRCDWYAYRSERIDGPDCRCNDKPPGLIVYPSEYENPTSGDIYTGSELEIAGAVPGGHWVKFRVYTLTADERFFEAFPAAAKQLTAAWNAAAVIDA